MCFSCDSWNVSFFLVDGDGLFIDGLPRALHEHLSQRLQISGGLSAVDAGLGQINSAVKHRSIILLLLIFKSRHIFRHIDAEFTALPISVVSPFIWLHGQ